FKYFTILFEDGFETLPFTGFIKIPPWDAQPGTGVVTVTGALFHQGTYCEKIEVDNGEWGYANVSFVGGNELYSRCYLRFDDAPDANGEFIPLGVRNRIDGNNFVMPMLWHDGADLYWGVELREATVYDHTNLEAVASNPAVDTWHCVETYMKSETGPATTDGIIRLWVENVLRVEKLNCDITDGNINRIDCGTSLNSTGARINVYIDCVVAADARIYCKVAPPVPAYPLIGKPLIAPIIVG
ncbi:unnamed protein product, partial [marine sediment metagenome]